MNRKILIAGEGGQGVQAIAKVAILTASKMGKKVVHLPNFGVEQRGGVSLAFIQISDNEISFPKFKVADIAVLLSHRAVKRATMHISPGTKIVFDNSIISLEELSDFKTEKIAIPASYNAKKELIPLVSNMIIFGALSVVLDLDKKTAKKEMLLYFKDKIKSKPELKHYNLAAFLSGRKIAKLLLRSSK